MLPGATVVLSNPVTGFKRDTVTDTQGVFSLRNLPPNTYHLQVSLQGFQNVREGRGRADVGPD